jgi:hypothetical protein
MQLSTYWVFPVKFCLIAISTKDLFYWKKAQLQKYLIGVSKTQEENQRDIKKLEEKSPVKNFLLWKIVEKAKVVKALVVL